MSSYKLFLCLALALFFGGALWWFRRRQRRGRLIPTPYPEVPVRIAQVGEWQIRYHLSGSGPYMVLIHGLGANLFCWRQILSRLNSHYTVIALDLPGFGQSSKLKGARYGLDEQVQRLGAFFDHMAIGQCHLVGNSMGGNIALWFGLNYPQRALSTVLIAPAASPRLIPLTAARLGWLATPIASLLGRTTISWAHRRTVSNKSLVDHGRVEETYRTYKSDPMAVRSFILATESIRDGRLMGRLKEVAGRVLILWGSQDRLVPRKVIDDLKAALPAAQAYNHPTGGHHLQEDEPQWVAEKIDAFISKALD